MEYPGDTILHRSRFGETKFSNWRPQDVNRMTVAPIGNMDDYTQFEEVVRTIHFDDYVSGRGRLVPNCLSKKSHSHLTETMKNENGLWFGMNENVNTRMFDHNWYGNVNFIINFNDFLNTWKHWQVYFMEIIEYRSSNASRLLLTNVNHDLPVELPVYNPRSWGGPWYRRQDGTNFFLHNARRYQNKSQNNYDHKVELFFVLSSEEIDLLMNMSRTEAADHQGANSGSSHMCKKYRSGLKRDEWKICPSPWSAEKTQEKLNKISF